MSRYLIDRIEASEKISVEYRTEVAGALGERRLEGLRLRSNGTDEREVAADALFVFVGPGAAHQLAGGRRPPRRPRGSC